MKKVLWGMSILAVVAGYILPLSAADAVKLDKVAPAADLAMEAQVKITALETALADNDAYLAAKKTGIPSDAGVLAVLAQALAEHPEKTTLKASAPDLRDAAIKLAKAGSFDDAKAALAAVKAAAGGKSSGAKVAAEWNKLSGLGALMVEVNKRNGKLRAASRKLPEDTAEASRHASVLAVLSIAAEADTHEVKKPADVADWKKFSADMRAASTEMAAALKEKSADKTTAAFKKVGMSCSQCHAKFRDSE